MVDFFPIYWPLFVHTFPTKMLSQEISIQCLHRNQNILPQHLAPKYTWLLVSDIIVLRKVFASLKAIAFTFYPMDTDKRVLPPIPFVYCFGLQNLRRHMCCRAIKNKWYRGRHTFISVHSKQTLAKGFFVRKR